MNGNERTGPAAAGLLLRAWPAAWRWTLTRPGAEVLAARAASDWGPLAALTLRTGGLEREVLAFLGEAETHDGHARLLQTRTRTIAPALAAVAGWQPEWRTNHHFVVPLDALRVAMAGAAMEVADSRPAWLEERECVGQRAEAYRCG